MGWITKTDPISGRVTKTYTSSPSSSGKSVSSSSSSSSISSSSGTKINSAGQTLYSDGYGGWTTAPSTSKAYADLYGGSSQTKPSSGGSSSSASGISSTAAKPSSGGLSSVSGTSVQYSSGSGSSSSYGTVSGSTNYHQDAIDAAARGDWSAVAKALAARQAKIDAQGGNDRGTSNAAILASLQKQYADSYNALSNSNKNTISGMATGNLNGLPVNASGWESGRDYLADAKQYASSGQLDAAYDALLRRGFKMYDTGSTGGGTSQDQAYALIRQLYNQSSMAQQEYQDQVARNRELLAAHPTQFGTAQNAALANKHFVSADGQYIIYYDSTGAPTAAKPNNGNAYSRQYSPEEIELMRQYYSGADGTNFAELQRQIHNNNVAYTGSGRLIDQYGNYASGTPVGTTSAYNWNPSVSAIPGAQYNQNQDLNVLKAILNRVNTGESFGVLGGGAGTGIGTGIMQPVTQPSLSVSPGGYSGYGSTGTLPGLENESLADILRQMYASNLDAQLAALRSTYEQDAAGIRAQDDLISRIYAGQRNQTAAQNDIQRMQMAEFGIMNGLNTGSSGQMALAQSLAYQNALGELGSAEAQSLADNALNLERLSAGYRASVDQANANNNAQLAQALYNEYVRQINAVQQAQAAALAQQNWERQFAYQQQQDALSQANWERQFGYAQAQDALSQANWEKQFQYGQNQDALSQSNWERQFAYGLAGDLLQSGIMPDTSTLSTAGISQSAAQSLVNAYQAAINAQLAKSYASASRSSGGSSDSGKPKLTYAQAKALLDAGVTSPDTVSAFQYYAGSDVYNQLYNKNKPQSSGEDYGAQYRGINQTVYYMRKMGKSNADIIAYLERQSDRDLSDNGYKNIIKNYGLT